MLCGVSQGFNAAVTAASSRVARMRSSEAFARYAPSRCRSQVHRFRLRVQFVLVDTNDDTLALVDQRLSRAEASSIIRFGRPASIAFACHRLRRSVG